MNGEQSVRIVCISKASSIDTIPTFCKRKIGFFIQRHRLFSVPGTFALGPTLRSLAAPVRATGTFDMLHFIQILLVLHWTAAEGKVN